VPAIDVSVLIPVYDNASTLEELLDRLIAVMEGLGRPFEIVAVDDGSRDRSFAILEERASADPRIRPYAMVRNYGSQAASCAAFDLARGRRVVHIDADLELLPEDIPAVLAPLDRGADLVCAYREQRRSPWLGRRLPSLLVNAYVRSRTGFSVRDVGCGLRGAESWVVKSLAAEGEARRYLTPLLLRRAHHVVEVPVRHEPKAIRGGHSFFTLAGIALDYYMLTAKRPFLVSGAISAVALAVGLVLLAVGPRLEGLVITGFAAVGGLVSLLGEYAQRIYQLGQGLPFYQLREAEKAIEVEAPREERASG
jgi:glycosyltransferase involved in cell wall biosynthesis